MTPLGVSGVGTGWSVDGVVCEHGRDELLQGPAFSLFPALAHTPPPLLALTRQANKGRGNPGKQEEGDGT